MKVEVKSIIIQIDDQNVSLTIDAALLLRDQLIDLFGSNLPSYGMTWHATETTVDGVGGSGAECSAKA